MEYRDFTIRIREIDEEGKHLIRITSSAGEYYGSFKNPIRKDELNNKLMNNRLAVRSSADVRAREGLQDISPVTSLDDLKEIGTLLYRSLFQQDVMTAFARSEGMLQENEGLRIRIRPDPTIDQYAELMSLPWEFLFDEGRRDFIDLRDNMIIVRYPEAGAPITRLAVRRSLKVLALASDPSDYAALRLGKEMRSLVNIFRDENVPIEVKILDEATIEALDDEAHRGNYHVFHFMGHGGFDPNTGKSALIFERRDGTGHPVNGEILRLALTDSIKLVFLNACESARIGEADPFTAVSTELALAGVPAVLAMQFPISDAAAIRFSRRFYTLLATGIPVDHCLSGGRRAIRLDPDIATEWGTPVLFMRSPDGVIFEITQESGANQ